jgi:hypothetical protein
VHSFVQLSSAHTVTDGETISSPEMISSKYITEQIYVDRKFECDIEDLMMVNIKITVFWGVTLCRLVDY